MAKFGIVGVVSATTIAFSSTFAIAQDVLLKAHDGSISMSGELLEFTGDSYRLRSAIGEITIDAAKVECIGEACPPPPVLTSEFRISGSTTLISALIPSLLEGFSLELDADMTVETGAEQETKIALNDFEGKELAQIELGTGGSSAGLRDVLEGNATLAVTTRPVRPAEVDALKSAELGDFSQSSQEKVLALDGLLVVTSPDNPVRAITETDTARIFSGEIANWAEVGGNNAPINLYIRAGDTGTGTVFYGLVMQPNGATITANATTLTSDAEVSDAVAQDPNGIGFTSFSNERNAKSLAIRGICGIQTPATAFTIKTEEYPLTRRLYIYQPGTDLPPHAEQFVDFIQSEVAQQIIAKTGFVDQGVSSEGVNEMGLRFVSAVLPSEAEVSLEDLQSMMADLITADRLSITYRFKPGSTELDTRAESDIIRLADQLARGEFANQELLLIGFTDSVGKPDINAALSEARALQVRDALVASAPAGKLDELPIHVLGYGEMSPLGCNETSNGRLINRRVEVWTRDLIRTID